LHTAWLSFVALAVLAALVASASRASALAGPDLPTPLAAGVRADAAAQSGAPLEGVAIVRIDAVTWSNGCIGVFPPGVACTEALVDGFVVWAVADGIGLRYHTDLSEAVLLADDDLEPSAIPGERLPDSAFPRAATEGRLVSGAMPLAGGFGLIVFGGGGYDQLLAASGCPAETARFWFTAGGEFVILVPTTQVGAVNAPFDALFGGTIPADTPLIGTCPSDSGIAGTITEGPITPVCRNDVPCDRPLVATLIATDAHGIEVARATSSADGSYRLGLQPGTYTVIPQKARPGPLPAVQALQVTVPEDAYPTVNISYDTGIR
jgi:hypothetical protein